MAHYPGCGVGGHCIPVDPYYLIEYAKDHGFNHDFLSLARRINNDMPAFTAEQVLEGLNAKRVALNGARVAVLGLSYKADIDDCRESPSFKIIEKLKAYGADIAAFDPFVPAQSNASSLDEAVRGAKAVLIATCHTIFKQEITPEYLAERGVLVLVDGRNCLPKEDFQKAGIEYRGIGR
jgi:nucleotide sugar dehydrogenase